MSLVTWSECRRFMLEYSERTRTPPYQHTRVSREAVLPLLDTALRNEMRRIVDAQPSSGQTIKEP